MLFFLTLFRFFPVSVEASQEVIRVPSDYLTIQEAIDRAAPGSIVLVDSGIYYEHLEVNKSISLMGQEKMSTIIDGGGSGTVITVVADNVLIDGFTIQNGGTEFFSGASIFLNQSYNSVISNNIITNSTSGISLDDSTGNTIFDNIVTKCGNFIPGSLYWGGAIDLLEDSSDNVISGNILANNVLYGLSLQSNFGNQIYGNVIADNEFYGIQLDCSDLNIIYHNNFINNHHQHSELYESYDNTWDNGAEGNYWDSYSGLDDGSGGRVAGDGVGDTNLPHLGLDNYPLTNPYGPIPIVWENTAYPVNLLSNSTISAFRFKQADKRITFTVSGLTNTTGFCNLTIPKNLLRDNPWKILLNSADITSQAVIKENQTHTSIYFTYNHSAYNIQIIGTWVIPEFPQTMIMPLLMILMSLSVVFAKKRFIKP